MNVPRANLAEEWRAMSRQGLRSAKALLNEQDFRGSVGRAYYASYHAATAATVAHGDDFARGWQNPSHDQLPELIRNNGDLSVSVRRRVSKLLRFLREHREDADYRPLRLVDRTTALDCLHAATTIIDLLEGDDG